MVLECVGVDDRCDAIEMYQEVFIGRFSDFCMLPWVGRNLKIHLSLMPGLQGCCCDVFCQVLAEGAVCEGVAMCLLEMFLSCLLAVGCTGGILKSAGKQFHSGSARNVFKVGVGVPLVQWGWFSKEG